MKSESRQPELPKLPHGDGVLVYTSNGKILYRKSIPVDGDYRRLAVTGRTLKECFDAMQKKEAEIQAGLQSASNQPLAVAIDEWLRLYKQPEVKPSSYGRLCITFDSQIKRMAIAGKPWKKIKTDDLQQAINALIPCGYSWSTIKKAYDMLNAFYTFQTRRDYLPRNPMELCRMPARENLLKQEKNIVYMSEQQIQAFSNEALSYAYGSSKLKYRYGPAFVFLIYTGLRIGELCALQWKDFDLEKRTVSITKNLMEIYNRDYGVGHEKVAQYTTKISTTKTRSTRIVPLNQKALMVYELMRQAAPYTDPGDYVLCTARRKPATPRQMERRLTYLLQSTGLDLPPCGCHMLRHTCASLLFSKKLQVEIIASILGHSPEVCRRTYIHFCQGQRAAAIQQIAEFNDI